MAEFQELIKNFDRTRDYIREFFVYGFKSRGEFSEKSGRTYDNERRRLESWLGGYIQESHTARGKQVAISVDSKSIPQNPLYGAWKSKSFTDRDIQLHFFLLDCLWNQPAGKTARELCDEMAEAYGQVFDSQTVRLKLKEYEELGILGARKAGKSLRYYLPAGPVEEITAGMTADAVDMTSGAVVGTASDVIVGAGAELVVKRNSAGKLWNHLMTAVAFFQEAAPFGFVGSTILDRQQMENRWFQFKHHFLVHTLEDGILLEILWAMRQERRILLRIQSRRSRRIVQEEGIPLRIFVSTQTGRRYLCMYQEKKRRFSCFRLDSIQKTWAGEVCGDYRRKGQLLEKNLCWCWGVSFGAGDKKVRKEEIRLRIHLDEEKEDYIRQRLLREGRGGTVTHVGKDEYEYVGTFFDTGEMLAWVKSFTGRIVKAEGDNASGLSLLRRDFRRMGEMYGEGDGERCGETHGEIRSEMYGAMCRGMHDEMRHEMRGGMRHGMNVEEENKNSPASQSPPNDQPPSSCHPPSNSQSSGNCQLPPNFQPPPNTHLFEEIYGCYYQITARILAEAFVHPVTAGRMREMALRYGYQESGSAVADRLTGGQWPFLQPTEEDAEENGNGSQSRRKITYRPILRNAGFLQPGALPLTKLQKAWLRALLSDRRIGLFLTDEEIHLLSQWLEKEEALYHQEDFYYYDQYLDGDGYEDGRYRENFRYILQAMETKQPLQVVYESRMGQIWEGYVACGQLQYSARDNKFRLCCLTGRDACLQRRRQTFFNVEKIKECSVYPQAVPGDISRFLTGGFFTGAFLTGGFPAGEEKIRRWVEIAISRERNGLERCMLHFASYEKHTRYEEEEGRYICRIYYDPADETGLLIDVLSFGPVIEVLGPAGFLGQVRKRVKMQGRWEW